MDLTNSEEPVIRHLRITLYIDMLIIEDDPDTVNFTKGSKFSVTVCVCLFQE